MLNDFDHFSIQPYFHDADTILHVLIFWLLSQFSIKEISIRLFISHILIYFDPKDLCSFIHRRCTALFISTHTRTHTKWLLLMLLLLFFLPGTKSNFTSNNHFKSEVIHDSIQLQHLNNRIIMKMSWQQCITIIIQLIDWFCVGTIIRSENEKFAISNCSFFSNDKMVLNLPLLCMKWKRSSKNSLRFGSSLISYN